MKTTWVEFGRLPGESDADWAAVCKDMARFLEAQAIEAQRAGTTEIGPVADESAVVADDAPKGDA